MNTLWAICPHNPKCYVQYNLMVHDKSPNSRLVHDGHPRETIQIDRVEKIANTTYSSKRRSSVQERFGQPPYIPWTSFLNKLRTNLILSTKHNDQSPLP